MKYWIILILIFLFLFNSCSKKNYYHYRTMKEINELKKHHRDINKADDLLDFLQN